MRTFYKSVLMILLYLFISIQAIGQNTNCNYIMFSYDELGNRIKREYVIDDCSETGENNGDSNSRVGDFSSDTSSSEQEANGITIYPNPSDGDFNIEASENSTLDNIQIYNSDGKLIFNEKPNINKVRISLNDKANGIYQVNIQSGTIIKCFSIVKY